MPSNMKMLEEFVKSATERKSTNKRKAESRFFVNIQNYEKVKKKPIRQVE